jgi:hypothetical protein
MPTNCALVLTTINRPTPHMQVLAEGCRTNDQAFFIVADQKTPAFTLAGARLVDLTEQDTSFPEVSRLTPRNHYARKNLGYLFAMQIGAREIQETDDDNMPRAAFWRRWSEPLTVDAVRTAHPWFNVYTMFTDSVVWPRGFPIDLVSRSNSATIQEERVKTPIVSGLADDDPDVDAIFRMTRKVPIRFGSRRPVFLKPGVWCPFNSQNTTFKESAFVLLYLPVHASPRLTDIWRSFVAQRCLWAAGDGVVFQEATVSQERNEHDLLRDFEQEIPGYLTNDRFRQVLESCRLCGSDMSRNLMLCYEALTGADLIQREELYAVRAWIRAVQRLKCG